MAPGRARGEYMPNTDTDRWQWGRWTEGAGGNGGPVVSTRHISAGRNIDTVILQVSGVV
jgi:hypothetical protein